ncbi:MAG TPA: hypothetical protein VNC14_03240, partial [Lapillicoccus sp.]|nr:hypothetical protein [Lapillicoccus sp.]
LGVSVKKAVDDGTKVATLSYSVVNRGGMASTGRTLVIAVPAPGKVASSTCKSIGSGKYQCTLGTIAAGKTVLAAITVAVPATPIGAFSVVATVTPGDGGAGADSQTTPLTCSCTATTTTTTAPPAPTNT